MFCKAVKIHLLYIFLLLFIYDNISKLPSNENPETNSYLEGNDELYSSVWCTGTNHSDRRCRFHNLCYYSEVNDFVFLKSSKSFIAGVPDDRFSPALTDFSSVENHNRMYFNYVELPAEFWSKSEIKILEGCALILKRFNPENLMHIFHDDLLPAYLAANEIGMFDSNLYSQTFLVFADDREPGPYTLLYDIFFGKKPLYLSSIDTDSVICFSNAYVGLSKSTTWYQYGFKEPQGSLAKDYNHMSNIIYKFTSHYKQYLGVKTDATSNCTVLLSRKMNRKILNEEDLISLIVDTTSTEVFLVDVNSEDIKTVLQKVSACSYLIGMHGAALILSLFLQPGSVVIEMFPYGILADYYTPYKTLSTFPGRHIAYHSWENKIKSNSFPHANNLPEFGGISHLPLEEQIAIQKLKFVKPTLCCYNPEWLYYIYQDTFVAVEDFLELLKFSVRNKPSGKSRTNSGKKSQVVYPSTVQGIICNVERNEDDEKRTAYHISWRPPWNLLIMNIVYLEYELWVQTEGVDDIKAYLTKKSSFTIFSSNTFFMWIRCISNGYEGPFTSDPLICFKDK